ncbi:SMC family ATPase [Nocardioides sp. JQ2195]|uniref:AAA family ATPase n=1 Tax=Nocardioides sp. JQ2195 TaxID=2592334 RepID=UPI00143E5B88|nr:SMC family ATPase [Nocardioides sp. JQ2195]QIX26640.1 SMC family ATPase [Nocardioides sp. JQ2195]
MRLHHLEVTAFGPFADTSSVDFDDLSSAGLFLLSGPTGSGKTSILDAVCFALYGDVPGDRNTAKRFRCDTAAPGVAPRVRLEATLAGRRFRLTRSPAWSRPKKRGTGTTTENASVLVEERIEGEWVSQSTRLDESGHLVTGLLGMTMPQFCQVAMLPQGRFQMFLRAKSEDRHKLLQQLFSTQRFEDIERWIRDHARRLHRQSQELQGAAARVVSRILEATGEGLPEAWSSDDLTPQMDNDELTAWVTSLVAVQQEQAAVASTALDEAERAEQVARERRDAGHRTADLQARGASARAEVQALTEADDQQRERRLRLSSARRAAPVVPLHRLVRASAQQRDRAVEQARTARAGVDELLGLHDATDEALRHLVRDLVAARTLAMNALPRETELIGLRRRIDRGRTELQDLSAQEARDLASTEELPPRIDELRARLGQAREAAAHAERLSGDVAGLDLRLSARARADGLRVELERATEQRRVAVDTCQGLKETWLELTEARIRGMAAEIATELAVGASCPVCGSAEHPHKAEPAAGAPTAESEKAARKALEDAEPARVALEDKVRELTATLEHAESDAGDEPADELRAQRAELEAQRAATARVGRTTGELESSLTLAERTLQSATENLAATRIRLAETRTRLEADQAAAREIDDDLRGLLDGTGHDHLSQLIAHHQQAIEVCETAVRLDAEVAAATERADESRAALDGWLDEHAFTDLGTALDAVLTDAAFQSLEQEASRHETRLAAARAVLAEADVAAALELPAPDLAVLDQETTRSRNELGSARTQAQVARTRAARLSALSDGLATALASWRPVHTSHAVAAELAAFVEGKSADNELRMRLSAYVLAWRLTQVVAAANERLLRMSDQRYTLEHTGRRGAGESRGGLSLLVLDEWSGELRDPATLSGGETFVVSLALALGLADVVTQEAGGVELDTLFVDEGFGSLDSQTLDDVMDTLDALRDGGRVVGVVSHVAEMRSRIPTQLRVGKDRGSGSSTAVVRDAS